MSYDDVIRRALTPAPRRRTQARSGLPFLRAWSAEAEILFDTAPLSKVMHDYITRPTVSKLTQNDASLIQSHQAQQVASFFATQSVATTTSPTQSIAQFSVLLPGFGSAIVGASKANPDIKSDLVNATGLGWTALADIARDMAAPHSVVDHVIAATQQLLQNPLMPQSASGDDPALSQTGRAQVFAWIREKNRTGGAFNL